VLQDLDIQHQGVDSLLHRRIVQGHHILGQVLRALVLLQLELRMETAHHRIPVAVVLAALHIRHKQVLEVVEIGRLPASALPAPNSHRPQSHKLEPHNLVSSSFPLLVQVVRQEGEETSCRNLAALDSVDHMDLGLDRHLGHYIQVVVPPLCVNSWVVGD
jgi:hypothetical protein